MQGFPQRLVRHRDFRRVYNQGRRHFAAHMTLFYLAREDRAGAGWRVGFTVSKMLGGAVERNRMKRRLREAVRLSAGQTEFSADVVIHPKRSLAGTEFAGLRNEIAKAFAAIEKSLAKEKLRR